MKVHPAAELFPMLGEAELRDLAEDIKKNGLQVPISTFDGQVIDGRNRLKACELAGVKPEFVEVSIDDPYAWVWSLNGERRHFKSDEQKYGVKKTCDRFSAELKRKANAVKAERNANISKAKSTSGTTCTTSVKEHKTREHAAKSAGVNKGAVARFESLENKSPELARKVVTGEMKFAEAARIAKKEEVKKAVSLPSAKYRIVYADPPWKYNDSKSFEEAGSMGADSQYPTMATRDICAMDIKSICEENAVLFCWATFPMLEDGLEVVKAWGFKYKTAFIWNKVRPNFGNYHNANAEILLVATRGSGVPDAKKRESQVQTIERTGRHSEKPRDFREMIDRLYPLGKRIELFSRKPAEGQWEVFGNEAE